MKKPKIHLVLKTAQETYVLKEDLWKVYQTGFSYPKDKFEDFIQNTSYYSLYYEGNKLVGFTAVYLDEIELKDQKVSLFGLGSTVILPEYRGLYLVHRTSLKFQLDLFKKSPFRPIYFWCVSGSYKSYCTVARFRIHYPAYQKETPPFYQELINYIGRTKFAKTYDPNTGTVVVEGMDVVDTVDQLSERHLNDPIIRHFYQSLQAKPPKYKGLHCLIMVAPVNIKNTIGWGVDYLKGQKRKRVNS